MGRSRGGPTTKIHALVDAEGRPIRLKLTEGQAHDGRSAADMLDTVEPGNILLADRASDSDALREEMNGHGAWANVRAMPNRVKPFAFSAWVYRQRNAVERFFTNSVSCSHIQPIVSPRGNATAARSLGRIERLICAAHERISFVTRTRSRHSNGSAKLHVHAVNDEWQRDRTHDMPGDHLRGGPGTVQENGEFIPSEPSHQGSRWDDFEQPHRDSTKQGVAEKVTEAIVDRFETIEIDKECSRQIGDLVQSLTQGLEEQATVWQLGERIVMRCVLDGGARGGSLSQRPLEVRYLGPQADRPARGRALLMNTDPAVTEEFAFGRSSSAMAGGHVGHEFLFASDRSRILAHRHAAPNKILKADTCLELGTRPCIDVPDLMAPGYQPIVSVPQHEPVWHAFYDVAQERPILRQYSCLPPPASSGTDCYEE